MSFGQHLQAMRGQAGLSRAELARRSSVPASTLRNWENDRGFPTAAVFLRLAEALGVTPERLAEGVDDPAEEEAKTALGADLSGVPEGRQSALKSKPAGALTSPLPKGPTDHASCCSTSSSSKRGRKRWCSVTRP
jgi:transcriptional regulator with XRE-family HTH domain